MKLYFAQTSPYARKVMVLLHEAARLEDVTVEPVHGSPVDPQTIPISKNPLGKLPALERDDGPAIYDSRVITRYLDDRFSSGLYPANRLWETLTVEATADGILDAALLMVYEGRLRSPDMQMSEWVEGQWSKIRRATEALESKWMSHLSGPLDMGQISVGCALGYIDFRLGDRDWRKACPDLAGWYEKMSARPSFLATRPDL